MEPHHWRIPNRMPGAVAGETERRQATQYIPARIIRGFGIFSDSLPALKPPGGSRFRGETKQTMCEMVV